MRGHSALIAVWLLLGGLAAPCAAQGTITLTYVGSQSVPTGTVVGGVEFGGISGIFYNPYTDRFVAVTDDSRNAGASRWWTLSLAYTGTSFTSVAVESQTQLRTAGGDPLPLADTEGIAGNLDGSFFVSHEGLAAGTDAVSSIPPWIWRFDGATGERLAGNTPIIQWNLDDGSGKTAGDSATPVLDGANNGTISGSKFSWTTGKFAGGLSFTPVFTGTPEHSIITAPMTPGIYNANNQATMSAWINPDGNQGASSYIMGVEGNGAYSFMRFYGGGGGLSVGYKALIPSLGSDQWIEVAYGALADFTNKWTRVVATFDRGVVQLWVDGELKATNDTYAGNATLRPATTLIVGAGSWMAGDASSAYSGLIDDVRLMNVVSPEPAATPVLPEAPLPVKFLPGDASGNPVAPGASNQSRGVVSNLSLECLGISPSRRFLFTANEAALKQDYNGTYDSSTNQAQNSETRIVRFTNVPGAPVASEEKVYRADQGTLFIFVRRFNTVPEILPVDDTGRMLVLERGLTQNDTNLGSYRIRIYLVDFNQADATNVAGINALVGASYTRLGKTLLWESSTNMDNVEAMCWGRDIDGFRTLVLASDNNFSAGQVSQFHVLRTNIPAVARHNLALAASGSGSVTASPAVPWYPDGADVTVTAAASPHWTFDGWSGASGGAANPLNLAMNTDLSLAASFLAPYDIWRRTHFTAEEIAEGIITAVSADPDGDGAPNLLECALGLDPRAAGASGLPGGALAGDWFTLTYLKDPSRADIRWQVEAADTLGDNSPWVPVPDELVGTEGGLERRRAALPLSGERGFLRLRLDRLF